MPKIRGFRGSRSRACPRQELGPVHQLLNSIILQEALPLVEFIPVVAVWAHAPDWGVLRFELCGGQVSGLIAAICTEDSLEQERVDPFRHSDSCSDGGRSGRAPDGVLGPTPMSVDAPFGKSSADRGRLFSKQTMRRTVADRRRTWRLPVAVPAAEWIRIASLDA